MEPDADGDDWPDAADCAPDDPAIYPCSPNEQPADTVDSDCDHLDTKRTVLSHIRRVLKPGGYLLLGGAESTLNLDAAFQRTELGRAAVFRHGGGAA